MLFDSDVFHQELGRASMSIGIPLESLHSFLRNVHLIHIKKYSYLLRNDARRILRDYKRGKTIVNISRAINYPPYMVARLVVENVVDFEGQNVRKAVTEAMRDPEGKLGNPDIIAAEYRDSETSLLAQSAGGRVSSRSCPFSDMPIPLPSQKLSRLAVEAIDAISSDPLYGPRQDRDRHAVGLEYEIILEQALSSMKIPFETEAQLRIKGTARTPDILLSCPVGVKVPTRRNENKNKGSKNVVLSRENNISTYEWKIVCWIDSKALYGDVQTHNTSVLPQAETYVHRFGPGMVLYWFGHAPLERLGDGHGDVIVMGWNLPSSLMLPTGEIVSCGSLTHSHIS